MRTYISPLYNMTAPCVNDVRRIRRRGCSGTTMHSTNRIVGLSAVDVEIVPCVLLLLAAVSHGRDASPECFDLPVSHSMALRLRDRRSSSSSVDKGRMNSRDTPPGACTIQPRITSVPASAALPVIATGWYELAGTTTGDPLDENETPDVLLHAALEFLVFIRLCCGTNLSCTFCKSRSNTYGFLNVTTKSKGSFCTRTVLVYTQW